jgi:hypothetical protein
MTAGCLIALATRPYVGWFLITASFALVLHASLRMRTRSVAQPLVLSIASIAILLLGIPFVWHRTSSSALQTLQTTERINATDNSNLRLEQVNYSTRADLVLNAGIGDAASRTTDLRWSCAARRICP